MQTFYLYIPNIQQLTTYQKKVQLKFKCIGKLYAFQMLQFSSCMNEGGHSELTQKVDVQQTQKQMDVLYNTF